MTYATLEHLVDEYGRDFVLELADRSDPPAGIVDQRTVDRALAGTDAVIDASLAVRYRLPLVEVPPMVVEIAVKIACHKLHRFTVSEKVQKDYEQALKDLRDLATGMKKLALAGIEPESSGSGGVIVTDRERMFTNESMRGFI